MNTKVKFYEDIYKNRTDYKRDLGPMYQNIVEYLDFRPTSVLDYGCGQGNLADLFQANMNARIAKYDPAIPEYSTLPEGRFDLAVNTDVLEHIPYEEIDGAVATIRRLADKAYFNVHLAHASEILSNGENAHCTIMPAHWWREKIRSHFGTAYLVPSSYPNSCSIITWEPSWGLKLRAFVKLNLLPLVRRATARVRHLFPSSGQ